MIYVDESICNGCGVCLDECEHGALTMQGPTAVIDPALCTSCGRCAEVCPTGAVILAEVISDTPPSPALAQSQGVQPIWAGASSISEARTTAGLPSVAPSAVKPTASRLEIAERLLSGVLSVVALALERRQRPQSRSNATAAPGTRRKVGTARGGRGLGRGVPRGGGLRLRTGRGRGAGKSLGGAVGRSSGQGRNNRCGGEGRNRAI